MNLREETIKVLRQCEVDLTEAGKILSGSGLQAVGTIMALAAGRVDEFLSRLEAGSWEETGSDYPSAMAAVLRGVPMRRKDWNRPHDVRLRDFGGLTIVAMTMKSGVTGPYVPSHCDVFARDWEALSRPEGSTST